MQADQHGRHQRQHEQVVAPEHDRSEREARGEGRGERPRRRPAREPYRQQHRRTVEDLGDTDGHDRDDEAWAPSEASQHEPLDQRARQRRQGQAHAQSGEVVPLALGRQVQRHDGGQRAQLGLGEVDDAVGAVHEDDAHGDESVEAARHRPEQDDPGREAAGQHGGRHRPRQQDGGGPAKFGAAPDVDALPGGRHRRLGYTGGSSVDHSPLVNRRPPWVATNVPWLPSADVALPSQ